jgi:hypothetical protein
MYRLKTNEWKEIKCYRDRAMYCSTTECVAWYGDDVNGFCYNVYGKDGMIRMPLTKEELDKRVASKLAHARFMVEEKFMRASLYPTGKEDHHEEEVDPITLAEYKSRYGVPVSPDFQRPMGCGDVFTGEFPNIYGCVPYEEIGFPEQDSKSYPCWWRKK